MSEIDARADVSSSSRIGSGVKIGAFAVVGVEVELGDGCILDHHAVVQGPALEIGDANEFHEFSTVNRGTVKGGGVTRIGSHNLIMSYAHIGHDCRVGDHTIFVNGGTLAGHVTVEDYATVGAFCPVQQFCRIGRHSYIGAHTVITQDVPPFSKVVSPRDSRCYGVNAIGLERQGFSPERIEAIEKAYRLLLRSKLNTSQAVEKMRETLAGSEDVLTLIQFIESAEHGLIK
jgi:UDP-N-acetylglucosamine acyltransferase